MDTKGQAGDATEYLIILAVVVIIALIVVAVGGIPMPNSLNTTKPPQDECKCDGCVVYHLENASQDRNVVRCCLNATWNNDTTHCDINYYAVYLKGLYTVND